jgi:hypothetical protein
MNDSSQFEPQETTNFELIDAFELAPSINFLLLEPESANRDLKKHRKPLSRGERVRKEATRRARRMLLQQQHKIFA